jgi:hypothetical protein
MTIPKPVRPKMKDYGISTKSDGLLDWSFVDSRMAAARNYWIGSVSPGGHPHIAPVWGVWMTGQFYFSTARTSAKGRNLAANPAVTLNLESGDEVVIFQGRVAEVTDRAELGRMAVDYKAKYAIQLEPDNAESGVYYVVKARTVLAWLESAFPKTATRWDFSGQR